MALKVEVRDDPALWVITLSGDDVTPEQIEELRRAVDRMLVARDFKPCVLELGALHYLSSEAVGIIANAHRCFSEKGSRLTVRNPTPAVTRVFMVTRLDRFLSIERNEGEGGPKG